MKKEIIIVPKDKSVLSVIQELKSDGKLENAWLFIHRDTLSKMVSHENAFADAYYGCGSVWPNIMNIRCRKPEFSIAFDSTTCADPENIFFIKAEE